MAKYFGKVGFRITRERAGHRGIWEELIIEKQYYGDLINDTSARLDSSGNINDNLTIDNVISIVSDPFAMTNFSRIQYAEYMGILWNVTSVKIQYPRLILTVGGVYNGPTAPIADDSGNDFGD